MLLTAVFLTAGLSGCKESPVPSASGSPSSSPSSSSSASPSPSSSASSSSSGSPSAGSVKIGLAVLTALSKSTDASGSTSSPSPSGSPSVSPSASPSESASPSPSASASPSPSGASGGGGKKSGLAQVDSTVVAVLLDKDGKILKCVIDAVQAAAGFDDKGKLLTPPTTVFKTKNELSDAYGMKKASGIGREWNEQAAAFAKYVEGKTPDEVKGIKVDETNKPTQADLKASVTISVGSFMDAIGMAASSAKPGGAAPTDRLSVGVITTMANSTAASADKNGLFEAASTYAAVTRDVSGRITGCILDSTQSKVSFSAAGKITSDLSETPKTKNEMGQSYGMKKASGIGKEWNEQAQAFAKYCMGKTAAEIAGIAVTDTGYAVSSDIKASVTISIGDFKAAIAKATVSQ